MYFFLSGMSSSRAIQSRTHCGRMMSTFPLVTNSLISYANASGYETAASKHRPERTRSSASVDRQRRLLRCYHLNASAPVGMYASLDEHFHSKRKESLPTVSSIPFGRDLPFSTSGLQKPLCRNYTIPT